MIIQPAQRLGEVKEYYFSRKLREIAQMREQGIDVINLGIGSPDLPAADGVIESLATSLGQEGAHQYQNYKGIPALREALASFYQRHFNTTLNAEHEILPLIGSKEGIMHISMAFLNAGDQVLIPNPSYPTYASATRLAGGTPVFYPLSADNNWLPNLDALQTHDLSKVKIMWVNYPHMPTGAKASRSFFERLVAFGQQHQILICNDNPYAFILNDAPLSLLSVPDAKSVALELNSLSKSHNMAGWRVGMVAGQADYIQTILRFKSNMDSGMFKPIQQAAIHALQLPNSWYEQQNAIYRARQKGIQQIFNDINCTFDADKGGLFVWGRIPDHYKNSYELSDQLLKEAGVFITPGGIFGSQGEQYIRASLCNDITIIQKARTRIAQIK